MANTQRTERQLLLNEIVNLFLELPKVHQENIRELFGFQTRTQGIKLLLFLTNRPVKFEGQNPSLNYREATDFSLRLLSLIEQRKEHFEQNNADSLIIFITAYCSKYMPESFEMALYLRKLIEHMFFLTTSDKMLLGHSLCLISERSFFEKRFLRNILTKNDIEFWEKVYLDSSDKVHFQFSESDLYDAYPQNYATNDFKGFESSEDKKGFKPLLSDRKGYSGEFRYRSIADTDLFLQFERELFNEGFIDSSLNYIKTHGNKRKLAILCKHVSTCYFKKKDRFRRTPGYKLQHYRQFLENRYCVKFRTEFNSVTADDIINLLENEYWGVRLSD